MLLKCEMWCDFKHQRTWFLEKCYSYVLNVCVIKKKKSITIVCLIEKVLIVCICNHVSLINKITTVTWKWDC